MRTCRSRRARGPTIIPTKTYVVYPDKFRVDATFAGAAERPGVQQRHRLGEGSGRRVRGAAGDAQRLRRDRPPRYVSAADRRRRGRLTVRQLPEEGQRRRRAESDRGQRSQGSMPVRLYIDRDYRIVRQTYTTPGPDGQSLAGGGSVLRLPQGQRHRRAVQGVGAAATVSKILDRTLKSVTFNTAVDLTLFQQPL